MEYLTHGIDSAVQKYHQLDQNENYKPLIDWDFEEIGEELMAQKDYKAAIKLFNLYSQKYPEDEFSWSLLGDAFLATGDTTNALKNFKESAKVNPDYEYAREQIQSIE